MRLLLLLALLPLAGCSTAVKDFMHAPDMSPVGSGIGDASPDAYVDLPPVAQAVAAPRAVNLYTDERIPMSATF